LGQGDETQGDDKFVRDKGAGLALIGNTPNLEKKNKKKQDEMMTRSQNNKMKPKGSQWGVSGKGGAR